MGSGSSLAAQPSKSVRKKPFLKEWDGEQLRKAPSNDLWPLRVCACVGTKVIFWLLSKLLIIKPVHNILWPLNKNMQWCCIKRKLSYEGEIVLNMSCSEAKLRNISKGHLTHYKIRHKNVYEFICICINIPLYAVNRRTIFYNTFTVTWAHATIKPLGFKKKVGIIENLEVQLCYRQLM